MIDDSSIVRYLGERKGLHALSESSRVVRTFNHFVNDLELIDILMVGRKFT